MLGMEVRRAQMPRKRGRGRPAMGGASAGFGSDGYFDARRLAEAATRPEDLSDSELRIET